MVGYGSIELQDCERWIDRNGLRGSLEAAWPLLGPTPTWAIKSFIRADQETILPVDVLTGWTETNLLPVLLRAVIA